MSVAASFLTHKLVVQPPLPWLGALCLAPPLLEVEYDLSRSSEPSGTALCDALAASVVEPGAAAAATALGPGCDPSAEAAPDWTLGMLRQAGQPPLLFATHIAHRSAFLGRPPLGRCTGVVMGSGDATAASTAPKPASIRDTRRSGTIRRRARARTRSFPHSRQGGAAHLPKLLPPRLDITAAGAAVSPLVT